MAEFFDISLIVEKKDSSLTKIKNFLFKQYNLVEGENFADLFLSKSIMVNYFHYELGDYDEVFIGLSDFNFNINAFDRDINTLSSFIECCFKNNPNLFFAFCSFELNGYLLGQINYITEMNDEIIKKFPIVYKKNIINNIPSIIINLGAQDIFLESDKVFQSVTK